MNEAGTAQTGSSRSEQWLSLIGLLIHNSFVFHDINESLKWCFQPITAKLNFTLFDLF